MTSRFAAPDGDNRRDRARQVTTTSTGRNSPCTRPLAQAVRAVARPPAPRREPGRLSAARAESFGATRASYKRSDKRRVRDPEVVMVIGIGIAVALVLLCTCMLAVKRKRAGRG
ncbi:hypothetical protein GCM10010519_05640 [Streptomyces lactacystinicus]